MQHCYLITAYKDQEQVEKLCELLLHRDSECFIFVHWDKKFGPFDLKSKTLLNNGRNVFIKSVFKVNWGSYNNLEAILLLARTALDWLKHNNVPRDKAFIHLLTGQDLPLCTQTKQEWLCRNYTVFMERKLLPDSNLKDGGFSRMRLKHDLCKYDLRTNKGLRSYRRSLFFQKLLRRVNPDFKGLSRLVKVFYKNSPYWSMRADVLYSILANLGTGYFKNFYIPEEFYFGTSLKLVLNSHEIPEVTLYNESLRYEDWDETKNSSVPAVLTEGHKVQEKFNSYLFARKFDFNSKLYENLYNQLYYMFR